MKKLLILLALVVFNYSNIFSQTEVSTRLQKLLNESDSQNYLKVLVYLQDQVNLDVLDAQLYMEKATPETRSYKVITALQEKAASTQGPLINYLEEKLVDWSVFSYKSFWIANFILIEAKPEIINEIKNRLDVAQLDIDAILDYDKPVERGKVTTDEILASEPGLKIVNADKLWQLGITGQGRILMGSDTGVRHTHVALNARWRGNFVPPSQAWFDPAGTTTPSDCDGHGTHTMGTMVGRSPAGDTVGLAIDAQWIAAMTICGSSPITSNCIAGFQWALNPDGNPSTTTDMPDAIGNSWYDSDVTATQCTGIYKTTLDALEAAGIAVVFSAGNNGPGVSTITPPKNINTDEVNVFCVANIQGALWLAGNNDPIASSSSRGPSTCGGTGSLLIKPEVSAPGTSVRSSYGSGDNTYSNLTGTSMACPHIVGAIGLLKQAFPTLTGKQIKLALYNTARDLGVAGEDNNYGKGLIDVFAAYQSLVAFLLPLNPFNINTPAASVKLTSFPNSSSSASVTWDTASAGATYKWIFGNVSNPRMIVLNSTTNSLNINLGVLDNLLAGKGLLPGDSIVGQWDVWAYRNNPPNFDSLKSTNGPRAITLKRGIPLVLPFSLLNPPNNSRVVTSVFNNSPVNINWRKSGDGVTYKWKFGVNVITNPILSLPSGNSGYDTSLSVINSGLDFILGGLGLSPGDSIVGQWAVWAFSGLDSLKSTETFGITFKRQSKGEVLLAYDSSSTACRASKDSVAAVLGRNGITFDLFNKGGNTSTNKISLRGYKKIFWLGEGTSIMSLAQKDSLKAYLNSGTVGAKSNLTIFAEDIGYMIGNSALPTYYDLDFMNNYLGASFVLDRPTGGAAHGLVGIAINSGKVDSTIGTWPDVLAVFGTGQPLYRFRYDPTVYNAIGYKTANFEVATFGVDLESLRPAIDSPPGSPVERMVMGAYNYLAIPVELTAFTTATSGNNVSLYWSTATEVNNSGFEIQRKSDGNNYASVGFVNGKGTTTEIQNYLFSDVKLVVGNYTYRLKQVDFDGSFQFSPEISVEVRLPAEFSLAQNYPNPFNPSTTINFSLATDAALSLKIFDILGQEVHSFINNEMKAGYHNYQFDASMLSSGIYFYQLTAKASSGFKFVDTKKMILTK